MRARLSILSIALGTALILVALVWRRADCPVFEPSTLELGAQALGLVHAEARLSNSSNRSFTLGQPEYSCGVHVAALSTDTLAPGENASLRMTLEIDAVGAIEKSVSVPFVQIDGGSDLACGVAVLPITGQGTGVPSVRPSLVALRDGSSGSWRAFSLRYCPGTPVGGPPRILASVREGEIRVASARSGLGGFYEVDLEYRPVGVRSYGHVRTPLWLCLAGSRDSRAETELAFEHVPPGMEGRWPRCLVAIPSSTTEPKSLFFPGVPLSDYELVSGEWPSWIRLGLHAEPEGSTFQIHLVASKSSSRPWSVFTVRLIGESEEEIVVRVAAHCSGS